MAKRILVLIESDLLVFPEGITMQPGTNVEVEDAAADKAIKAGVAQPSRDQKVYGHEDEFMPVRQKYGR